MKKLILLIFCTLSALAAGVTLDLPVSADLFEARRTKTNEALTALNDGKHEFLGILSTSQRDALSPTGRPTIYNTTTARFEGWKGTGWQPLSGELLTLSGTTLSLESGSSVSLLPLFAYTPSGNLSATTLATAIAELDTEKQPAGEYVAAEDLTAGLALKQDAATAATDSELTAGLALKQDAATAALAADLTAGLALKQDAATAATDSELTAGLALKQDAATAATDSELTAGLALKQDASTAATDTELTDGLALKQDAATAATDSELTAGLALKQDASTAATDTELTAGLALKQDILEAGDIGPTELASTAVTPGSYTLASITVDADGRITAAATGSASSTDDQTAEEVAVTPAGGISATDVLAALYELDTEKQSVLSADDVGPNELESTAVTPGSYTLASITVDEDGRITAAASGSAGAGDLSADDLDTQIELNALRLDLSGAFSAAGSDLAGATELSLSGAQAQRARVTASGAGQGVRLLAAVAEVVTLIENVSAYDVLVYPASGEDLGLGSGVPLLCYAGRSLSVKGNSGGTWTAYADRKELYTRVVSSGYTLGSLDPAELRGGVFYVTASATLTVPALGSTADYYFTVIPVGTAVATVDPNGFDGLVLNGAASALADGVAVVSSGTAGDVAVFTHYTAAALMVTARGFASE